MLVNSFKCGIYIQITANMYKNIVFLYILKKRAYDQNTITSKKRAQKQQLAA